MCSYKSSIFFLMVKKCPYGFGEVLESCIFHRTINTSGYSSATGYSFRICKAQSRSCRTMKGVKTSPHSSLNAKEMPPFFFFCLLKILQKTHYHIWGNTFSKSPFNLLTEELLLHCHLPAHLALITCLSTWTIVFKVLFLQMHKITKLDPSLILPFYSWFQMSNVRGSFLAKSRVFYIISVQIPKSQYWKLKELQDLSSWDRRSQNPDSPLPPYSSSETETQS